jgi:acyl carrier protein
MTARSVTEIRAWLVGRLAALVPEFTEEIPDGTSLVDEGLCLDSIKILDLVTEIEAELGIRIEEEEIAPETFGTVGRLVRFLERK